MKYPKAGDLQRATGVELNPAKANPYEVRSASGLEGVYADQDDAEFHASELRRDGVQGVVVERRRLPSYADRAVAARALREEEHAARSYAERAAQARSPELREVYKHAGEEEEQHAAMLRPFAKNPSLSDRLFIGMYPTGIVYADRAHEIDGDYARIAFLPYSTLQLRWAPGVRELPPELRRAVEDDSMRYKRGDLLEVSSSGQTVRLGYSDEEYDRIRRQAEEDAEAEVESRRRNPGPRVLREKWGDSSQIVVERQRYGISAWLESTRGGGRHPISFGDERPETLREAMEAAKRFLRRVYGKTNPAGRGRGALRNVFLEQQPNGWHVDAHYENTRMDYGPFATKDQGAQMREAIIESSLQGNPAGQLTAKGERMYEDIKRGYEERGEPRAKEIAARTVAARSSQIPGLKKRR